MILKQNFVFLFGFIIWSSEVTEVFCGATEAQMLSTGKLMREVCLPKFPKISKEMADGIAGGTLPDEKDPKCYVNCIMEMMQMMKKGKFLYESSLKQVDILMPDEYKDDYNAGMTTCKDAANGIKNSCDASYVIFNCLTGAISKFIFP